MKIVNKLTLAHLKENKGRMVITILGIIVSVSMITALFVGVASFLDYYERMTISSTGNVHVFLGDIDSGVSDEQIEKLRADDRIEYVGLVEIMRSSDTSGGKISNAVNDRLSTVNMNRANADYYKQLQWQNLSGEIPQNPNELVVYREFIDKNNLDWKIGDTVSISLGKRYMPSSFIQFSITGAYQYGETFEEKEKNQFKIVGIIEDKCQSDQVCDFYSGLDENSVVNADITLKKVTPFSVLTIKDIVRDLGITTQKQYNRFVSLNDTLLATHFCFVPDNTMLKALVPTSLVILLIIMLVAVVLIYNTFGMSLSERTRYLGMLSSVGATKTQVRSSVYFEGLILGAIGIPVGLGVGIGGVAIILNLLGDRINNFMFLDNIVKFDLKTVVPLWSVLSIVIFSVITIFISSCIPAKKASSITPIDAIRQTNDIKVSARRLKSSKLIRKIFGYEGELANKNLKRNSKKSNFITASIAISVVLFLSVNYFCNIYASLNIGNTDLPYQIDLSMGDINYLDDFRKELDEMEGVDKYYSIQNVPFEYNDGQPDSHIFTNQDISKHDVTTKEYSEIWDNISLYVNEIEDEDFNALCEANGIDYKQYYKEENTGLGNNKVLLMNNISHKDDGSTVFTDKVIGEKIYYGNFTPDEDSPLDDDGNYTNYIELDIDENWGTYEVGDLIAYDDDNYVCHLNEPLSISAYMPVSMSQTFSTENLSDEFNKTQYIMGIETTEHKKVTEELNELFDYNEKYASGSTWIYDLVEDKENIYALITVLQMLLYAFITLITLVTLANIINTISTSINARRKEFAMIKSVGVTPKGFKKMVALESIFYGAKALIFAIPISIGISYLLNVIVADGRIPFKLDALMYIIVVVAVMLIVGFSMLLSMHKVKNDNIIETIKEDIT